MTKDAFLEALRRQAVESARPANVRSEVLDTAGRLINTDRAQAYGDYKSQCEALAKVWSVSLGHPVTAEQASHMLMGLKYVRIMTERRRDSEVDMAGYAALHAEHFKPELPEG